ncbi:hypothetical protein D3C86_1240410 [compost metagenome]
MITIPPLPTVPPKPIETPGPEPATTTSQVMGTVTVGTWAQTLPEMTPIIPVHKTLKYAFFKINVMFFIVNLFWLLNSGFMISSFGRCSVCNE